MNLEERRSVDDCKLTIGAAGWSAQSDLVCENGERLWKVEAVRNGVKVISHAPTQVSAWMRAVKYTS